jgi:Tol biopolymer transport system component/imidazolonepropionase-like amidohydrolase
MDGFTRRRFIQSVAVTGASASAVSLPGIASAQLAPAPTEVIRGARTLTFTQVTNGSAAVSPSGDRLIAEVQGILWSLPREGGAAVPLTPADLEPTRPVWSPDGSTVAMCAYKGGGFHIWTMAPDGSRLRQVTDGPWDDRGVTWSPDGSRIAFASERGGDPAQGSHYHVWTVDVRTGALTQVTDGDHDDYDPSWSADGAAILFVRAEAQGGRTIASVPAGGGEVTVVRTVGTGSVVCPAASPDGGRIAYVHLTEGDNGPAADLVVDGKPITAGEDVFAVPVRWMSGDELLYLADGQFRVRRLDSGDAAVVPFVARLDVSTADYRTKTYDFDSTAAQPVRGIHHPVLAPDGGSIAFIALNALWVMPVGGRPRKLVQARPEHYVQMPVWAPDGRSILYCSDREGLYAVYRHNLADGNETTLADGGRVNPALSPDGTRLACHDLAGNLLVRDLASGADRSYGPPLGANGLPGPPSWSSDGRYLATCDRNRLTPRFREGYNLIRVIDTRTGEASLHAPAGHMSLSDRYASGPVWSPDGRTMAFIAESALWVLPVRADGTPAGAPQRLTDEAADHPSWAGDSRTLLYLSNGRLRLINRDGLQRRTLPVPLEYRRRPPSSSEVIRVHAGRLWDGTGDRVLEDVDIVVRGNRIVSVEPHRPGTHGGERRVDASDHTVLPGLWDSHIHPWQYTYGGRQGAVNLAYGITTTVSVGGFAYEGVRIRESIADGSMAAPRLFTTGELIDGTRVAYTMGRAHGTRAGLRRTLDRAVALDYDFVKTYVRAPGWIMAEAARVAHQKLGVLAGSHLCYPGLNLGQDVTTHIRATERLEVGHGTSTLGRAYQDVHEIYRDRDFHLLATPFSALALLGADPALADDPRVTELLPPWDVAMVRQEAAQPPTAAELRALETEVGIYRQMLADGGIIALGTDSPLTPSGLHLHLGLRALRRHGVSAMQALRTVTVLPARAFGVQDHLGTVEPGKLADLVMIAGDPFQDFATMVRTTMTMRDGVLRRQEDLLAQHPALLARTDTDDWLETSRAMRGDTC